MLFQVEHALRALQMHPRRVWTQHGHSRMVLEPTTEAAATDAPSPQLILTATRVPFPKGPLIL